MKIVDLPVNKDAKAMSEMLKGFAQIAIANKTYFDSLVKEGFTEAQSLEIVKAFKWF